MDRDFEDGSYDDFDYVCCVNEDGSNQSVYLEYENSDEDDQLDDYTAFYHKSAFFVFQVEGFRSGFESQDDIELLNEHGELMGHLVLACDGVGFKLTRVTLSRRISAIFDEANSDNLSGELPYHFKKSYVLIKSDFINEYKSKYMDSSAHWACYTHDVRPSVLTQSPGHFSAVNGLFFPTEEHKAKLSSIAFSENGFDRFLKKYQLIELMYDYICVLKLRGLKGDISNFSKIMQDYSRGELDSLTRFCKENVKGAYVRAIEGIINRNYSYISTMEEIFENNGKDSNPLKNGAWDDVKVDLNSQKMTYSEYRALAMSRRKDKFSALGGNGFSINDPELYDLRLISVVCYWIYRIRCSVAHAKLGEFIFKPEHESFVVEFAEAIVDQLIEAIYSNEELSKLVTKNQKIDELMQEL